MGLHRTTFRLLFGVFFAFCVSPALATADTFLVAPFENGVRTADLDWVGESFAEALTESLQFNGRTAVARDERVAALERLGLRANGPLTHATWLRLGEEVGADWLVLGRFELDSGHLRGRAQVLDLAGLSLFPPVEDADAFEHLLDVQTRLAWKVLRQLDPHFPLSLSSFQQRRPQVSISAFESYVRGLLAPEREQQLRYFLQAARLEPRYAAPAFRLAMLYYMDGDYASAGRWFTQAAGDPRFATEAGFYASLSYFFAGDLARAAQALALVTERAPSAEVWNNLGVIASRRGDAAAESYFARALQAEPTNADIHFNLGLHYLRRGEWELALRALQRALQINPRDTDAHFLRSQALRSLGRLEEAESARQQAIGDNPALALSLERRRLELDRLQMELRRHELARESRPQ